MKFPVFSLNFGLPETSSLLTASSSGESANQRFLSGGAKSATTRALGLRAQRFFDWLGDELRVGARGRLSR